MIKFKDLMTGDFNRDTVETFSDTFLVIVGSPLIAVGFFAYNSYRGVKYLGKQAIGKIKANKEMTTHEMTHTDIPKITKANKPKHLGLKK